MFMVFDFCIPTRGTKVPHTPDWLHEIKYDGYRVLLERDGNRVRLISRRSAATGMTGPGVIPGLSSPP
jgi:ATP-dependent DNA ligase